MFKKIAIATVFTTAMTVMMHLPANAAFKAVPVEDGLTTSMFAPSVGVDIVEGKHHGYRHFRHFGVYGHRSYSPCYWAWRRGYKVWVCY